MNLERRTIAFNRFIFRCWLLFRRIMPRRRCISFGKNKYGKIPTIEKIYVINLEREPGRWHRMKRELSRILDWSGVEILSLTHRYVAIDGKDFLNEPVKNAEVNPFYTLNDQLFVEPQPLVLPSRLELNAPIRMSRAENAVAQSHINVWKRIVAEKHEFVLILEDDIWFRLQFASYMDRAWREIMAENRGEKSFDVLYLSYLEVKNGAPKSYLSDHIFKPLRGIWHLSGYVLSRKGAEKLLGLLPCRGPVDLWINHQFNVLDVFATKVSLISQRRDMTSSNSYSILPMLTKVGAINSERASLFQIHPTEYPVFAFGAEGSGQSSLAMALSMLGYRCCSDLEDLPTTEMELLLTGSADRIFDAYVNIGSLNSKIAELRSRYPKAKFIVTGLMNTTSFSIGSTFEEDLRGTDFVILNTEEINKWKVICEYLRCAPPSCTYPELNDIGQRELVENGLADNYLICRIPKRDQSPWIVDSRSYWNGISTKPFKNIRFNGEALIGLSDEFEEYDESSWQLRSDTFTDNMALFRPENISFLPGKGAVLSIKKEALGVRNYSAASICSIGQYLYGKFEVTIQASSVPGVITGIFLHRNSPRQEIDIEITGNCPDRLLVNVFYNPGSEGAKFDYGYRGTPTHIELGFDASKACHRFAIEWFPNEIRWFVDDRLVHKRNIWNPTPIPDLPLTFHVNNWITCSAQLAGRIQDKRLPTVTILEKVTIEAHPVGVGRGDEYDVEEYIKQEEVSQNNLYNENIIIQSRP